MEKLSLIVPALFSWAAWAQRELDMDFGTRFGFAIMILAGFSLMILVGAIIYIVTAWNTRGPRIR